jgi:hypothetical protein
MKQEGYYVQRPFWEQPAIRVAVKSKFYINRAVRANPVLALPFRP